MVCDVAPKYLGAGHGHRFGEDVAAVLIAINLDTIDPIFRILLSCAFALLVGNAAGHVPTILFWEIVTTSCLSPTSP